MTKAILTIVLLAGFFWLAACGVSACGPAEADSSPDDTALEAIVAQLSQRQGVAGIDEIDCGKLTDDDFERVGEALMSTMHPDAKEHNFMDQMMGGEGSESLKQAHIRMGQEYLGCQGDADTFRRFRGAGMMMDETNWQANSPTSYPSMMSWGRFGMGFGAIMLVLLITYLVSGTAYFIRELIKGR